LTLQIIEKFWNINLNREKLKLEVEISRIEKEKRRLELEEMIRKRKAEYFFRTPSYPVEKTSLLRLRM